MFTAHGRAKAVDDLENASEFLTKFLIPADAVAGLAADLFYLGIRRSQLFPDLENLARELRGDA